MILKIERGFKVATENEPANVAVPTYVRVGDVPESDIIKILESYDLSVTPLSTLDVRCEIGNLGDDIYEERNYTVPLGTHFGPDVKSEVRSYHLTAYCIKKEISRKERIGRFEIDIEPYHGPGVFGGRTLDGIQGKITFFSDENTIFRLKDEDKATAVAKQLEESLFDLYVGRRSELFESKKYSCDTKPL
jgi:hypothetical protein